MKALSIRQPWAWLIANGHKDIENRSWATHMRGPFLIHAAKGMTRFEYEEARDLAKLLGVKIPDPDRLERGGIVGRASIMDCVEESESPWFFGRYGFVISSATPLPFSEARGRLGFFDFEAANAETK